MIMTTITLQFGQCGNQIGSVLYEEIYDDIKTDPIKTGVSKKANMDYVAESVNKWFHVNANGAWEVRSILIDTENKVVSKTKSNERYKFRNVVANSYGGAANNWAYGYCSKSKLLMTDIEEGVRKEIERGCGVSSIIGILSSAGGTGSGVGSKTLEVLRDEYPNKIITSIVVLPYTRGEIVTQNYNSVLTLAKLYNVSDQIILYENDVMHKMCSKTLCFSKVTFENINGLIAQQLATVFQPLQNNTIWNVVKRLTSHPSYKFIQTRSAPHVALEHIKFEANATWSLIVKDLKSAITAHDFKNRKSKIPKKLTCVSNVFVGRGQISVTDEDLKLLLDRSLYVPWVPAEYQLSTFCQNRYFKENKKFATFLTNNNYVCNSLDVVLTDALALFTNKAYLHHYERFGVNEQIFADTFDVFSDILQSYITL
ncbi:hypothetical protein FQR65_LT10458 [Abscondita terminalis]|nr:hypothetical protein FQR65_LT10458 [Abscondita terminalis]